MPITRPFDLYAQEYDRWFDTHPWAFQSEVTALQRFMPERGDFLEVGVGTGRFAQALGVRWGVDPSAAMRSLCLSRGIEAVEGVAEALPLGDGRFDAVLLVTTLCFLDDAHAALTEALRVLRGEGRLLVGIIDIRSGLGRSYHDQRDGSRFYREARFRSTPEVASAILRAGFPAPLIAQTLFGSIESMREADPVRPGYGNGAFVVLATAKGRDMTAIQEALAAQGPPWIESEVPR